MAIESNKAKMPESFFICQLIKRCGQRRTCPARRRSYLVVLWIFFIGGIGLGRTECSMDISHCWLPEVWRDEDFHNGQLYVVSSFVGD